MTRPSLYRVPQTLWDRSVQPRLAFKTQTPRGSGSRLLYLQLGNRQRDFKLRWDLFLGCSAYNQSPALPSVFISIPGFCVWCGLDEVTLRHRTSAGPELYHMGGGGGEATDGVRTAEVERQARGSIVQVNLPSQHSNCHQFFL